jgi:trimeric autotransporter adhesin
VHRFKIIGWLGAALLVIAGGHFSSSLAQVTCSVALSPSSASIAAEGGLLTFYASTSCPITLTSGYSWLHPSPAQTSASGNISTVVDSNPSSSRNGFVTVTPTDNHQVLFSVQQSGASTNGCTPTRLLVVSTSGATFSVGFPVVISINVVNDCGSPVTSGSVVVSFSNGDPPISLTSLGNGTWSGTWFPGNVQQQVALTASAISFLGTTAISGITTFISSNISSSSPAISGVVDGASFLVRYLAPGSLVSIFGQNLASTTAISGSVPLPISLSGTSVFVGGTPAPLFFVSPNQINAILPYSLATNTLQSLAVVKGNNLATANIQIAAAAPGVFTINQSGSGAGAILNGDFTLNTPSNPAARGAFVSIFCAGLGAVMPAVTDGAPPTSISATTNQVVVRINNGAALVAFAGLAPGFVGLYQVNAIVPASTPIGGQIPVDVGVIVSGTPVFSPVITMAVK